MLVLLCLFHFCCIGIVLLCILFCFSHLHKEDAICQENCFFSLFFLFYFYIFFLFLLHFVLILVSRCSLNFYSISVLAFVLLLCQILYFSCYYNYFLYLLAIFVHLIYNFQLFLKETLSFFQFQIFGPFILFGY